jgi:hypothetical protein
MLILLFFMQKKDPEPPSEKYDSESFDESMTENEQAEETQTVNNIETSQPTETSQPSTKLLHFSFALYFFLNFSLRGILGVLETFGAHQYQEYVSIF